VLYELFVGKVELTVFLTSPSKESHTGNGSGSNCSSVSSSVSSSSVSSSSVSNSTSDGSRNSKELKFEQEILRGLRPLLPLFRNVGLNVLIENCWAQSPKDRPSAFDILDSLEVLQENTEPRIQCDSEVLHIAENTEKIKQTYEMEESYLSLVGKFGILSVSEPAAGQGQGAEAKEIAKLNKPRLSDQVWNLVHNNWHRWSAQMFQSLEP
jgi:hypothetical protein